MLVAGCHGARRAAPDAGSPAAPAKPTAAKAAGVASRPGDGGTGAGVLPGNRNEQRRAARTLLRQGHFQAAEATLEALWRTGDDAASRTDGILAAAAHARTGDDAGALALLAEAERRGLPTGHLEDLAAAIASDVPDPADLARRLVGDPAGIHTHVRAALVAALYERAGKPRLAIPYWEQATRLAPKQVAYWRELMRLYAVTGHPHRLERALRQVVTLEPRYEPARVDLCAILTRQGHDAEALAVARPPAGAYSELDRAVVTGDVLRRSGRFADAVAAYHEVLAGHPDACGARLGLARARLASGDVKRGSRDLYALVAHRLGGVPCDVAEAARTLLSNPHTRKVMGPRLARLAAHGGGADPATLRAIVGHLEGTHPTGRTRATASARPHAGE